MESGRGAIEQKKEEQGKMSGKERGRECGRISIRLSPLMDDPVSPKAAAAPPLLLSRRPFLRLFCAHPFSLQREGEERARKQRRACTIFLSNNTCPPPSSSVPSELLAPPPEPGPVVAVTRCPHFPPPPRIVNGWGTDGDNISLGRAEGRQERGRGGGREGRGEERSNGPETTRADWMTTSEREGAGK